MIDSVLKGTGNSRFLKSAVPAGTSWADALAMLQAGTFPIDFNGINTEGFRQVGTPLNKANLLKDATAAQIGLPPSTTPDGMFQALGNTGELHVWRKTVVTKEPVPEVPGSYTLGTAQRRLIGTRTTSQTNIQSTIKNISRSNSITVDLEGNVSLDNPSTFSTQIAPWTGSGTIRDVFDDYKYIEFTDTTEGSYCDLGLPRNTVFLVNPDSTFIGAGYGSGEKAYIYDAQEVIGVPGHPYIPAGTTTTYPVSTNPNAYQEGDDAKEAGYTLGEVKTGKHILSYQHSDLNEIHWEYSSRITVSDDGTVSLVSPSSEDIDGGDYTSVAENLIGKFARPTEDHSGFRTNVIVFFPSDATVTRDTTTYGYAAMTISKYQPVTGYAAIPAGTTIEYLGKLGDKARVQVLSYVGTGTYGADNPCSLTFYFAPMFILIAGSDSFAMCIGNSVVTCYRMLYSNFPQNITTRSNQGRTISFYQTTPDYGEQAQCNSSGVTYNVIAIG